MLSGILPKNSSFGSGSRTQRMDTQESIKRNSFEKSVETFYKRTKALKRKDVAQLKTITYILNRSLQTSVKDLSDDTSTIKSNTLKKAFKVAFDLESLFKGSVQFSDTEKESMLHYLRFNARHEDESDRKLFSSTELSALTTMLLDTQYPYIDLNKGRIPLLLDNAVRGTVFKDHSRMIVSALIDILSDKDAIKTGKVRLSYTVDQDLESLQRCIQMREIPKDRETIKSLITQVVQYFSFYDESEYVDKLERICGLESQASLVDVSRDTFTAMLPMVSVDVINPKYYVKLFEQLKDVSDSDCKLRIELRDKLKLQLENVSSWNEDRVLTLSMIIPFYTLEELQTCIAPLLKKRKDELINTIKNGLPLFINTIDPLLELLGNRVKKDVETWKYEHTGALVLYKFNRDLPAFKNEIRAQLVPDTFQKTVVDIYNGDMGQFHGFKAMRCSNANHTMFVLKTILEDRDVTSTAKALKAAAILELLSNARFDDLDAVTIIYDHAEEGILQEYVSPILSQKLLSFDDATRILVLKRVLVLENSVEYVKETLFNSTALDTDLLPSVVRHAISSLSKHKREYGTISDPSPFIKPNEFVKYIKYLREEYNASGNQAEVTRLNALKEPLKETWDPYNFKQLETLLNQPIQTKSILKEAASVAISLYGQSHYEHQSDLNIQMLDLFVRNRLNDDDEKRKMQIEVICKRLSNQRDECVEKITMLFTDSRGVIDRIGLVLPKAIKYKLGENIYNQLVAATHISAKELLATSRLLDIDGSYGGRIKGILLNPSEKRLSWLSQEDDRTIKDAVLRGMRDASQIYLGRLDSLITLLGPRYKTYCLAEQLLRYVQESDDQDEYFENMLEGRGGNTTNQRDVLHSVTLFLYEVGRSTPIEISEAFKELSSNKQQLLERLRGHFADPDTRPMTPIDVTDEVESEGLSDLTEDTMVSNDEQEKYLERVKAGYKRLRNNDKSIAVYQSITDMLTRDRKQTICDLDLNASVKLSKGTTLVLQVAALIEHLSTSVTNEVKIKEILDSVYQSMTTLAPRLTIMSQYFSHHFSSVRNNYIILSEEKISSVMARLLDIVFDSNHDHEKVRDAAKSVVKQLIPLLKKRKIDLDHRVILVERNLKLQTNLTLNSASSSFEATVKTNFKRTLPQLKKEIEECYISEELKNKEHFRSASNTVKRIIAGELCYPGLKAFRWVSSETAVEELAAILNTPTKTFAEGFLKIAVIVELSINPKLEKDAVPSVLSKEDTDKIEGLKKIVDLVIAELKENADLDI